MNTLRKGYQRQIYRMKQKHTSKSLDPKFSLAHQTPVIHHLHLIDQLLQEIVFCYVELMDRLCLVFFKFCLRKIIF
jgi:hypothetical protein